MNKLNEHNFVFPDKVKLEMHRLKETKNSKRFLILDRMVEKTICRYVP
jgi:hypothetical protein